MALGARLLEAAFFRIDGEVSRVEVGTAAPLRAPETVAMLFSERLSALGSEWDAGFGFDMVRLAVLRSEPLDATQIDLAGEGGGARPTSPGSVDRLGARLGPARITRFVPVDTHIPERAAAVAGRSPALAAAPAWAMPERGCRNAARTAAPPLRPSRAGRGDRRSAGGPAAPFPLAPRDASRWRARKGRSASRRNGGSRRMASRATRDYFRVEDAEGRRYWLFREGLYGREDIHPSGICTDCSREVI